MYKVEFRDHDEGERVLFSTDDRVAYAWVLFTLTTFPERFTKISATPLGDQPSRTVICPMTDGLSAFRDVHTV